MNVNYKALEMSESSNKHLKLRGTASGTRHFEFTPRCVLVIEPIIGAEGVWTYSRHFLSMIRKICDKHCVLIFADEALTCGGNI